MEVDEENEGTYTKKRRYVRSKKERSKRVNIRRCDATEEQFF